MIGRKGLVAEWSRTWGPAHKGGGSSPTQMKFFSLSFTPANKYIIDINRLWRVGGQSGVVVVSRTRDPWTFQRQLEVHKGTWFETPLG